MYRNKVRIAERGETLSDGEYFLVVHICVFNRKNQMLIQKRQPFKKGWAGLWDISASGAAQSGESSSQAANRELNEEIGIDYDFSAKRPYVSVSYTAGFDDYYIVELEVNPDELILQYEEVEQVRWADKYEILSMIDNGEFIPYHKGFIEMLFDMRNDFGTINDY